ncbi:MAG: hypothetical protein ABJZ55_01905 [Fuerstiella sp.]
MDDKFRLMKWPTGQLQAEVTASVEHCRVLNNTIDNWEIRLRGLAKAGNAKTVIDAIQKSLKEYKLRRDIAEVRIDLCREILTDRQHDMVGAQS